MSGIFAGLLAGGGASGDASWSYVSMLLSTTSLSNANNNLFVDSSGAFNPISRTGNTTQGSATPYGASWSNYFDGSGDYERIASNQTALQFGTGDFTIEGWVYSAGGTGTYQHILTGGSSWVSGSGGVFWYYNGGAPTLGCAWNQVTPNPAIQSGTLSINTWYHFAVVRSGNTLTLYINGTSVGTLSVTGISLAVNNSSQTNIGGGGWDQDYAGYLSNLRVVKGTAVYTSAFTPPTTPLTAITNTSLLTCQSNRFRDASTNNFTITAFGNTAVQKFSPFSPGSPGIVYNQSDITNWSGYFDGTGDYLTVPDNAALEPGSSNLTWEMWINTTNSTQYATFYSRMPAAFATGMWSLMMNLASSTAGDVGLYVADFSTSSPLLQTTGVNVRDGAWHHIAVVRNGSAWVLYVDGFSRATGTWAGTIADISGGPSIGRDEFYTRTYLGYISNLRIVKGTAVYTSAFTPPTSPLTAITNTSLLTCQNAAFTDNSTNNFVVTINGNTTVTGNNPFQVGYWSNYFDGSGDYLSVASNAAFGYGTGDFTIEFWMNVSTVSGAQVLYEQRSANGAYPTIYLNGAVLTYFANSADRITGSSLSVNTWYHVAVARSGTSTKMFLNGVQDGSTYSDSTSYLTSPVKIATDYTNAVFVTGYISNVRAVKGTAVYTSAFTPPTSPLTAISGTSLLTCQASRFIDSSSNAFTITVNGNTSVQSLNPFYTSTIASNGGSMYFDGTGDYLQIPTNPSLQFGSSNFTVEFWMNLVARDTSGTCVFGNYNSFTTGALSFFAGHSTSSTTLYQVAVNGTFPAIQSTTAVVYNSWNHFAIVRNGNTLTLYINGVADGTFSMTGISINGVGNNWWLGSAQDAPSNYELNGYLANFRITKGAAVYTVNFTPPTAPLTPSANTTLLVNGMNAGAYDATAINDMETVGNAQVSTVQSKFGGSSVYFDGSGDGLLGTNSLVGYTAGNFTWECWVNFTSTSGNPCLIATTSGAERDLLYFNSSTGITYVINRGGSDQVTISQGATTGWSTGTWYHVAVVRNSNTYTIYRDGTSVATGTSAYAKSNLNAPITLGYSNYSASYLYLNGYIDDARITNGVARYTANFTAPTQAFPTY